MGQAQAQIDYPKDIGFEQVWASLDSLTQKHKELAQYMEESKREYDKRFGEMNNRFGEVVECMIAPGIQDKFYEMGIVYEDVSTNRKVRDHKNKIYFEVDVFLQNGDTAMLVEIKTNLTISYINEHIDRLEKMRKYADLHGDKRRFFGAVAGVVVPPNVKDYALDNGLYLIEPTGENFNITSPKNKPKEW